MLKNVIGGRGREFLLVCKGGGGDSLFRVFLGFEGYYRLEFIFVWGCL